MKDAAKIKGSTIRDNPTDMIDIGGKMKDKKKERSVRYTRRKDAMNDNARVAKLFSNRSCKGTSQHYRKHTQAEYRWGTGSGHVG